MLHRLTGRFIGPKIENEKKPRKMFSKRKKKEGWLTEVELELELDVEVDDDEVVVEVVEPPAVLVTSLPVISR